MFYADDVGLFDILRQNFWPDAAENKCVWRDRFLFFCHFDIFLVESTIALKKEVNTIFSLLCDFPEMRWICGHALKVDSLGSNATITCIDIKTRRKA